MRRMANGTTFAQGFMGKGGDPSLSSMTGGAGFIRACPENSGGRFENIHAVGIVALDAVHAPLDYRMMSWQVKLSLGFEMTAKTGLRLFSWIENKAPAPAPGLNMLAARSMAALAAGQSLKPGTIHLQMCMRTRSETANVGRMAINAPVVPHVDRPGNIERLHDRLFKLRTRGDKQGQNKTQ